MIKRSLLFLTALLLSLILLLSAQDILSYQKPPQSIINLLETPVSPAVRISSDGEWMLLLEMPGLPSISELSQPELRLAGLRINPASNGQSRTSAYKFTVIGSGSPVYWVTRGYAVLDNADMPVVGESNKEPNDTFVEQIKTPLLLIHGQADNNSGTFPILIVVSSR